MVSSGTGRPGSPSLPTMIDSYLQLSCRTRWGQASQLRHCVAWDGSGTPDPLRGVLNWYVLRSLRGVLDFATLPCRQRSRGASRTWFTFLVSHHEPEPWLRDYIKAVIDESRLTGVPGSLRSLAPSDRRSTPVSALHPRHVDVLSLDYVRLGNAAQQIFVALDSDPYLRLTKRQVTNLLALAPEPLKTKQASELALRHPAQRVLHHRIAPSQQTSRNWNSRHGPLGADS